MKMKTAYSVPGYNYAYHRRWEHTIKFITYPDGKVLVAGGAYFEKRLEKHYCKVFDYTHFDLNSKWELIGKYDTILCFQTIEHLLNPLLFLVECKNHLRDKGLLYISYPTHGTKPFWSSGHFNEYDKSRFEYLLEVAGLEVVKYQEKTMWRRIKGIRSIIRNIPIGWCKHQYYCVRAE